MKLTPSAKQAMEQIKDLHDTLQTFAVRDAESLGKALEAVYTFVINDRYKGNRPFNYDWTLSSTDLTEGIRQALESFGYDYKQPTQMRNSQPLGSVLIWISRSFCDPKIEFDESYGEDRIWA